MKGGSWLKSLWRTVRKVKRRILPPRPAQGHLRYSGPYASWSEAVEASVGYDSPVVLEKVRAAVVEVLEGRSGYERDGTTFEQRPEKYTLREKLSALLRADDTVVDFGGGLSGTYINNRDLLDGRFRRFYVIEQPAFCAVGSALAREYDLPIRFLDSLDELGESRVDIVILSGVLQCIDSWKSIARHVVQLRPRHILLDRHPLVEDFTRIMVQENDGYYETKVSYPVRMFNAQEFLGAFPEYQAIDAWPSDFDPAEYRGFHLVPR